MTSGMKKNKKITSATLIDTSVGLAFKIACSAPCIDDEVNRSLRISSLEIGGVTANSTLITRTLTLKPLTLGVNRRT
jgi:hypothetical protein